MNLWDSTLRRLFSQSVRVSGLGVLLDAGGILHHVGPLPQFEGLASAEKAWPSGLLRDIELRRQTKAGVQRVLAKSLQEHFMSEGTRGGAAALVVLAHACVDVGLTDLVIVGMGVAPNEWLEAFHSFHGEDDPRFKKTRSCDRWADTEHARSRISHLGLLAKRDLLNRVGIEASIDEWESELATAEDWSIIDSCRHDAVHRDFLGEKFDSIRPRVPGFLLSAMAFCLSLGDRYGLRGAAREDDEATESS